MNRVRVKICGFTRAQDAHQAALLGADAIGLVFYPSSPRHVEVAQAQAIAAALPPFVTLTALFVNASVDQVRTVLAQVPVDLLQFHGDETPTYCQAFGRPYLKAVRMKEGVDLHDMAQHYASAQGLLLDTYVSNMPGGTGLAFDWQRIPSTVNKPLILAGGLTVDNVTTAIAQARPFGVDVSGGVEAQKGIKDWNKMADFIQRCALC